MSNQELEKMIKDSWIWKGYEWRVAVMKFKIEWYENFLLFRFISQKINLNKINCFKLELQEMYGKMDDYINSFDDLKGEIK